MKYCVVFFFILFCLNGFGQISFEGCGEVIKTEYKGGFLYVIQDQDNTGPFGRVVFTPGGGSSGWEVKWKYKDLTEQEGTYNADSSQITVDLPGNGEYTFWARKQGIVVKEEVFHVFYDYVPEFSITLTDVFNCTAVSIAAITDFQAPDYEGFEGINPVGYFLPGKTVPIEFPGYASALGEKQEAFPVDSEDQEVTVTIRDRFGFSWVSKPAHYTSVIPKAVAELELGNTVHVVGEVNDEMGQAPLEVAFYSSSSVNAGSYQWLLYKDTASMTDDLATTLTDSLLNEQIRTSPEFTYTYENTGRYKVRLIAINSLGKHCTDTTAPLYVNVVESLVDVPNVFTPNGDGKNDIFKVQALSVDEFRAVILNRWGRKLHEWTDPREGWDGRINGKLANPGTYFYIVTARGREKINPPEYVKKGALMLIR